jgi:hypothetical protein
MDKENMVYVHSGILFNHKKMSWAGGVAQMVERLPSNLASVRLVVYVPVPPHTQKRSFAI